MFHLQVRVDLVSKCKLFCWYFTRTSLKAKSQCFDNETFRSKRLDFLSRNCVCAGEFQLQIDLPASSLTASLCKLVAKRNL